MTLQPLKYKNKCWNMISSNLPVFAIEDYSKVGQLIKPQMQNEHKALHPDCAFVFVQSNKYFFAINVAMDKRGCNYFDWIFAPGRIVWDKCNQSSTFSDCELAATNLFTSVRLFPFMWNGMLQGKSMTEGRIMQGNKKLNEKRIHPTQKPVALYSWLLTKYAEEGWKILDTHLGSGSIAIACEQLGNHS